MAKILIVDDSNAILVDLKDVLEESGHQVVTAVDGKDGYSKAEAEPYFDLIISDFNMPGMDGLTMIGKIKSLERYAQVPIGMLTTESSDELRSMGKQAGVLVWFVKPFEKARLLAALDLIFKKFPPRASAA